MQGVCSVGRDWSCIIRGPGALADTGCTGAGLLSSSVGMGIAVRATPSPSEFTASCFGVGDACSFWGESPTPIPTVCQALGTVCDAAGGGPLSSLEATHIHRALELARVAVRKLDGANVEKLAGLAIDCSASRAFCCCATMTVRVPRQAEHCHSATMYRCQSATTSQADSRPLTERRTEG